MGKRLKERVQKRVQMSALRSSSEPEAVFILVFLCTGVLPKTSSKHERAHRHGYLVCPAEVVSHPMATTQFLSQCKLDRSG